MRAAVHTRYGPPDVVSVVDVEQPLPKPGQLLVRVHLSTVNRTDCGYRSASPFLTRAFTGLRRPRRTILGTEFAGEVEAVGNGVTGFAVGDRVYGYNEGEFGAHAQYLVIPETGPVATVPPDVSYRDIVASTEGAHYARNYIDRLDLGPDDNVMVYGATGAIGSAGLQLAKATGATVTAVCGPDHLDLVAGLGADRVVDYTAGDFTDDDERYDFVFDAVGKSSYPACRGLLRRGGVYGSTELGPYNLNPLLALVTRFSSTKVIFPIPRFDQQMIHELGSMVGTGAFCPLIDRTYPLDEIVEAYRYVEQGQKVGNVLIDLS